MYQHGWYQIAFEHDLEADLTPLEFAQRRLMAVKRQGAIRIFDATCPHRGAHLAYGGKVNGEVVVCPFHDLRIRLGSGADTELAVREYSCLVRGRMVFVRLSDREDPNLPPVLEEIQQHHTFVPGFEMRADVTFEIAAENALDNLHFKGVHGLLNEPVFTVASGPYGELTAEGDFVIPPSAWTSGRPARVQYRTAAFSPGILISELHGEPPYNYIIISSATPAAEPHKCVIRVSLALQPPFDPHFADALLEASRQGLEKDCAIWNHLALDHTPHWTQRDTGAMAFARFCGGFRG